MHVQNRWSGDSSNYRTIRNERYCLKKYESVTLNFEECPHYCWHVELDCCLTRMSINIRNDMSFDQIMERLNFRRLKSFQFGVPIWGTVLQTFLNIFFHIWDNFKHDWSEDCQTGYDILNGHSCKRMWPAVILRFLVTRDCTIHFHAHLNFLNK